MNTLRSCVRSARQLPQLKRLLSHHAPPVSTAPPTFLRQHYIVSPHPLSSVFSVRHIRTGPDLTERDEIPLPINWGIQIVPEKTVFIIERFGKYVKTLPAGIHFLIPFVDRIAYVHSLKEDVISEFHLTVLTKDNVILSIKGLLGIRIVDPKLASYHIDNRNRNPKCTVIALAKAFMVGKIRQITFDQTFQEKDTFSEKIVEYVNGCAKNLGMQCRYELDDISLVDGLSFVMHKQAAVEEMVILAEALSEGQAIQEGTEQMKLFEQALDNILKEAITLLLYSITAGDPISVASQNLALYKKLIFVLNSAHSHAHAHAPGEDSKSAFPKVSDGKSHNVAGES